MTKTQMITRNDDRQLKQKIREQQCIMNELFFRRESAAILVDLQMQSTRGYMQHGKISVFTHSVMVSRYSVRLAEFLKLKVEKKSLLRGALLHDYFLYDWHITKKEAINGLHGFVHPVIAAKNAQQQFALNDKEVNIILSHMWPLTITRLPKSREGWIVSCVDKYCSLLETLHIAPYSNEKVNDFFLECENNA